MSTPLPEDVLQSAANKNGLPGAESAQPVQPATKLLRGPLKRWCSVPHSPPPLRSICQAGILPYVGLELLFRFHVLRTSNGPTQQRNELLLSCG